MTGWRLGYAVGRRDVIDSVTKVLESNTSCPSSISQAAAEAAFRGPSEPIREMVSAYRARRDLVVAMLESTELLLHKPQGAFYCMVDVSGTGLSSQEFALTLLRDRGVSVAPGSAFGSTDSAVRVAITSAPNVLQEGVMRLRTQIAELSESGGDP